MGMVDTMSKLDISAATYELHTEQGSLGLYEVRKHTIGILLFK